MELGGWRGAERGKTIIRIYHTRIFFSVKKSVLLFLGTNDFLEKLHTEGPRGTRNSFNLCHTTLPVSGGWALQAFSVALAIAPLPWFLVHTGLVFQSHVMSHAPRLPSSYLLLIFLPFWAFLYCSSPSCFLVHFFIHLFSCGGFIAFPYNNLHVCSLHSWC